MTTMEPARPRLPRVLGVLLVVVGVAFLSFVVILLGLIRNAGSWVLAGMLLFASLKGYLGLVGGARLVASPTTPLLQPTEWRVLGAGYCVVAALIMVGAVTGEGWGYAFAGALFSGLAPVWFAVARQHERSLNKSSLASNSNSAVAGDGGEHRL